MTLMIESISNGLLTGLCLSALVIGSGASYFLWQMVLRNKSRKIVSEAEAEAEVIRKEKILQAKERFLQLKTEHEKVINEKNSRIGQAESRIKQKELTLSQKLEETQRKKMRLTLSEKT
jgi:ribonuclease Y